MNWLRQLLPRIPKLNLKIFLKAHIKEKGVVILAFLIIVSIFYLCFREDVIIKWGLPAFIGSNLCWHIQKLRKRA